jgi:hypothetical protein
MKKTNLFAAIFLFLIILMMFASCESLGRKPGTQIDNPPIVEIPPVVGVDQYNDKLDDPTFAKLPADVKKYLQSLSAAFKNHDEDFLLAQGEAMFEQQIRPIYNDEEYFIMLYRIGGDIWKAPAVSDISHIEYTGWESGDPVMEIRGRFFSDDKQIVPCVIMLAWKLDEPKIIGLYP